MARHILGVLAVTIATPYIGVAGLFDFTRAPYINLLNIGLTDVWRSLWSVYFFGTISMMKYGVAIGITAFASALLINGLAVSSATIVIGAYSFLGFCFGTHAIAVHLNQHWWLLPNFMIAGAICGWIYWRIAIHDKNSPGEASPS